MRKLGNIFSWLCVAVLGGVFVFHISANFVENFRLVTGGTVTQGIIRFPTVCSKRGYPSQPLVVQFTDVHGMQLEEPALDCGSIINPSRLEGDHVTIVYLQDDPTIARIQDDLVLQFWVLEAPLLLIALLILLLVLRRLMRHSVKS